MNSWDLLVRAGDVDAPVEEVTDAAIAALLEAAHAEHEVDQPKRRGVPRTVAVGISATAAVVVVVALVVALPRDGQTPIGRTAPSQVLSSRTIRLISDATAAVAASGTAVESTDTTGDVVSLPSSTLDVTFSGENVNYLVTSSGQGAQGVENRIVDGQLYLYVKGRDLQMHWYHDTTPNAAGSLSFPNPQTLLSVIGPSLGLESLGEVDLNGVRLTHLRAMTPGALSDLGIHGIVGKATSFEAWVDSDDVIRQIAATTTYQTCSLGGGLNHAPTAPQTAPSPTQSPGTIWASPDLKAKALPSGKCSAATSRVQITYNDLGAPESITVPPGAVDQRLVG
jgi:hypothetical protein